MALSREQQIELQLKRNRNKVNISSTPSVFIDSRTSFYKEGNLESPTTRLQDNPNFIFPGPTTRTMGGLPYRPIRGYIRRLNEFYSRMGEGASDIQNRRCNFQFQPETIVRSVSANSYDTQFFFNQRPEQLTVPIPGQSTYGIKLLFNREAEVTSGYYMSKGKQVKGKGFSSIYDPLLETSTEIADLLEGNFDQSWVTKIGVLADIMVLDGVIGQGISKETLSIINKISAAQQTNTTDTTVGGKNGDAEKDDQDKDQALANEAASYWLNEDKSNVNLGNQAFLVPTPVRIMLSNLMIIEGFVLSSAVNFHKFSKRFIPTQATVELSVQALYIGFAKKATLLTQDTTLTESGSSPDEKTQTQSEKDAEKATKDGVSNFYKSAEHNGSGKDLLHYILNVGPQQNFNFELELTDAGKDFRIDTLGGSNGGNPSFHWEGSMSMYWHQHITGASNSRGQTRTSATGGASAYVVGAPLDLTLRKWGLKDNPLVFAKGTGEIYEDLRITGPIRIAKHVIGQTDSFAPMLGFNQSDAKWDMYLPESNVPRPFEQDKFKVKLEITVKLERNGVMYPIGQKIVFEQIVACGDDVLFKNLSISKLPET